MGSIIDGVQRRVRAVAGVRSVDVEIDTDTFWTPALMSHEGRAKLGARRTGSMDRVPVKPRQWKQTVIRT
jgi:metal-sulfur cluster biosynthetic enzyme